MGILEKSKKYDKSQNNLKSEDSKSDITQKQVAGEASTQCQVGTIIVNQGITEERVRNIFAEMIPQVLEKYTEEAHEIANSRIQKLETAVIPRIIELDGAVNAFSDPAFQILLKKAQLTAAATERTDDYSLLSELLVCHIQKKSDRKTGTGISQAIEIVDDIDNDALCALTIAQIMYLMVPKTGSITEGLSLLNELFSKLLYMELPGGRDWIDHLDILRAIRILPFAHTKLMDFFFKRYDGYTCVGIKIDSEEYIKACERLKSIDFTPDIFIKHELLEGYVRLPIKYYEDINDLQVPINNNQRKITGAEKDILEEIWSMYSTDANSIKIVKQRIIDAWDSFDALKKIRLWWDNIPVEFEITKVGKVLAYTNAKRCEPDLPDVM